MLHSLGRGCAPQTGFTHASQTPSWPPIVAEAQPAALTQPAEPVGLGPGAEQSRGLAWSSRLLWREKRAGKLSLDPPVSSGAAPSSLQRRRGRERLGEKQRGLPKSQLVSTHFYNIKC
ncbi:hypothetical protein MHYP_G00180710 [Metynnis hypsauchen]